MFQKHALFLDFYIFSISLGLWVNEEAILKMDTKREVCWCCNKIKNHPKINGFKCKKCIKFKPSSSNNNAAYAGAQPITRRNTSWDDESRAEIIDVQHLSVPSPMRSLSSSSAASNERPRKRALLCGVTYKHWKHRLLGTVNDVLNMQDLLINNFAYSKHNIRILTGEFISFLPSFLIFLKNDVFTFHHLFCYWLRNMLLW